MADDVARMQPPNTPIVCQGLSAQETHIVRDKDETVASIGYHKELCQFLGLSPGGGQAVRLVELTKDADDDGVEGKVIFSALPITETNC